MLSQKIEDAFNEQINAELFSEYLYLSMAAWFEGKGLKGMSHWMRLQAGEERIHGMKFYDFVLERSGRVVLAAIDGPQTEWESPLAAFEAAYQHELMISGRINKLVDLSLSEKDHAANAFLQWFVTEQVEEEASALEIVDQLRLVGDNNAVIFMLNRELGQRGVSTGA